MERLRIVGLLGLIGCGIDNTVHDPNNQEYPSHIPDGLINPEKTDVFFEPSPQPVDILFVVDKSCSMANDTLAMNTGFPAFIDYVTERNIDYHIGLISTSNDEELGGGRLVEFANFSFITPQTLNPAWILSSMNIVAASRGEREAGIDAVSAALGPRIERGENQGFFRHGVPLQIVTITDEEDQSYIWTPQSLIFRLYDWMNAHDNRVYYSAILTLPESALTCDFQISDETVGYRYLEIVEKVNGIAIDICQNDWATSLGAIAEYATPEPTTEYMLEKNPVEETITLLVERNGVVLSFEEEGDWEYDSTRNSVWINSSNGTPYGHQNGDVVKVTYMVDKY